MIGTLRSLGILALVALVGCGGDDEDDTPSNNNNMTQECSTGLPNGMATVELSGGFTASDSITVACGINPSAPYQASSQAIPEGMAVPPYFELRLQDDTEWGTSVRFGGELIEETTLNVIVRTEEDFGPPIGFGWLAQPVDSTGYNWDVTSGSLELTKVTVTDQNSVTLISGTATVSYGGESAIEAVITLTDFPVSVVQ